MADVPIPVENKSIFDPEAGRNTKIEKVVRTATDIAGTNLVNEVVSENLKKLRDQSSVEAGEKDRQYMQSSESTDIPVQAVKKSRWSWLTGK